MKDRIWAGLFVIYALIILIDYIVFILCRAKLCLNFPY